MCAPPPCHTDRPTGKCNCQSPFSHGGTTGIAGDLHGDIVRDPGDIATLAPLSVRHSVRPSTVDKRDAGVLPTSHFSVATCEAWRSFATTSWHPTTMLPLSPSTGPAAHANRRRRRAYVAESWRHTRPCHCPALNLR